MAQFVVMVDFEGTDAGGGRLALDAGALIDDAHYPVTGLAAQGLVTVPFVSEMVGPLAIYNNWKASHRHPETGLYLNQLFLAAGVPGYGPSGGGGGPNVSETLATAASDPVTTIVIIPTPPLDFNLYLQGFIQAASPGFATFSRRWDFVARWNHFAGFVFVQSPTLITADPWAAFAPGIDIIFDDGPALDEVRVRVQPDAAFAFNWQLEATSKVVG